MFKMSWALINDGAGQWFGNDFQAAARALDLGVNDICSAGIDEDVRAHWCRRYLEPLQGRITHEGRAAIEAGEDWVDGLGPILVRLSPMQGGTDGPPPR
ncbi:hypothetical protein ACFVW8_35955 [Streptomyces sp. NPDC058221]|uniref:hypothetical protein n=1 Tax=Streptomyces sp. NPDC058221 TaxID=3346388 RepID=UPI0036E6F352